MPTKQEILDKWVTCQCWDAKDGGKIYNSSCPQHSQEPESAMDEYAEIKAVEFADWIRKEPIFNSFEGKWDYGRKELSTIELYQLFLQQTNNK